MAVSKEIVNQAIKQLTDIYDLKGGKIDAADKGDYILLSLNGSGYTIYPTDERNIEDIISFIVADQNLQPKTISKVQEDVEGNVTANHQFNVGDLCKYKYNDEYMEENNGVEIELKAISAKEPYCRITDIDEDSITVNFDIAENSDKNLPYSGEYGAMPNELTVVDENNVYGTKECVTNPANVPVFESDESAGNDIPPLSEDYPTLLVALDSEKDAEITYKTLIDIEKSSDSPNQEVIDLLEKILADEKEHIALLSALSASNNSDYVAEDSQEQFNEYVDNIITN